METFISICRLRKQRNTLNFRAVNFALDMYLFISKIKK